MGNRIDEGSKVPREKAIDRVHACDGRRRREARREPSRHGQPSEPDREDELEDQAKPEDWDVVGERPVEACSEVRKPVTSGPGEGADANAEESRHEHRREGELNRGRHVIRNILEDRSLQSSGGVPSRKIAVIGSPGTTRRRKNVNVTSKKSIGNMRATRVMTYARKEAVDPAIYPRTVFGSGRGKEEGFRDPALTTR